MPSLIGLYFFFLLSMGVGWGREEWRERGMEEDRERERDKEGERGRRAVLPCMCGVLCSAAPVDAAVFFCYSLPYFI